MKKMILLLGLSFCATVSARAENLAIPYRNETELYIDSSQGNSNVENYGLKQLSFYRWEDQSAQVKGSYYLSKSEGAETFRKWDLKLRFDQNIAKDLGVFADHLIEANRYAGFIQRNSFDVGFRHLWLNNPTDQIVGEVGYRYSFEDRIPPERDVNLNMGRAYIEYTHNWDERVYATFWIEYLSDLGSAENYFVNFEPSVTTSLTKILYLRVAYVSFYTNRPPTQKLLRDTTFYTSLVAKF